MIPGNVDEIRSRIRSNSAEILHSISCAKTGNPFAAEPDDERRLARLQSKAQLSQREAEAVDAAIKSAAARTEAPNAGAFAEASADLVGPAPDRAERIWGDTTDFVNVSFLEIGSKAARAVGRVSFRNEKPQGTGFLIGEGLFLTNHHVIPSAQFAAQLALDFDFELDLKGNRRSVTRFAIDSSFFVTSPDTQSGLDYAVIAVGAPLAGELPLSSFGANRLSAAKDKHMLGEFANIVQHPSGRFKEVVLRENRLVGRYDHALHYVADTEPGSSGSPVFNSEWQVIALHHWGGPWREVIDDQGNPVQTEINEGIRVSAIIADLRQRLPSLSGPVRERLLRVLAMGESGEGPVVETDEGSGKGGSVRSSSAPFIDRDGRVTWTVPIELSVRLPGLVGAGSQPTPPPPAPVDVPQGPNTSNGQEADSIAAYADRGGYKRGFIPGHDIPLPKLGPDQLAIAAVNRGAEAGDDPHELKYHHFSLVMNAKRRLAFFTACNIDGETAKEVNRKTKVVKPLMLASIGHESFEDLGEADSWARDPRVLNNEFTGEDFYEKQKIPGFPKPTEKGRIARMFQKGHLVRRLDPCWGEDRIALLAEEDSFHWTNACPQVGFFNQGTAGADLPGTGGGKLWRAVENYVLRNALVEKLRVTSFTGPIFADDDRPYRGLKVPGRFFKIAVWSEGGLLRSLAMIADQRPVMKVWPEALFTGAESLSEAEAFMDASELEGVEDFLSTVAEIEGQTGLDFGAEVGNADVRKGEAMVRIDAFPALGAISVRRAHSKSTARESKRSRRKKAAPK